MQMKHPGNRGVGRKQLRKLLLIPLNAATGNIVY